MRAVEQAGERRLASLESVRALAALGVLAGHAMLFSRLQDGRRPEGLFDELVFGGGLGVFCFFALTGYLIYLPFARRDFGPPGRQVDLRRYAINRALRIFPLYYAVLVVLLLLREGGGSLEQWARFVLFLQNFSQESVGTVDGPMWSLVVELHFYALLPLLALGLRAVCGRNAGRAVALLLVAGGLAMLLHLVKVELITGSTPDLRWSYSLPTTFGFFVPGMLVAIARVRMDVAGRRLPGVLDSGDAWLLASVPVWLFVIDDFQRLPLAALASALVVGGCVLTTRRGPLMRVMECRPLALLGVLSYALYLIHFPLMEDLAGEVSSFPLLLVVGFSVSLALAVVAYRVVEAPFLRRRQDWA